MGGRTTRNERFRRGERKMTDERRGDERSPSFTEVELITQGSEGETSFPIILRDTGGTGVGGVSVGQGAFAPRGDAILRDTASGDRPVRVVWTKKLAEYVHMVGLEVVDG
jgi:hypothetical protein